MSTGGPLSFASPRRNLVPPGVTVITFSTVSFSSQRGGPARSVEIVCGGGGDAPPEAHLRIHFQLRSRVSIDVQHRQVDLRESELANIILTCSVQPMGRCSHLRASSCLVLPPVGSSAESFTGAGSKTPGPSPPFPGLPVPGRRGEVPRGLRCQRSWGGRHLGPHRAPRFPLPGRARATESVSRLRARCHRGRSSLRGVGLPQVTLGRKRSMEAPKPCKRACPASRGSLSGAAPN
jgi:hypothetical protein